MCRFSLKWIDLGQHPQGNKQLKERGWKVAVCPTPSTLDLQTSEVESVVKVQDLDLTMDSLW